MNDDHSDNRVDRRASRLVPAKAVSGSTLAIARVREHLLRIALAADDPLAADARAALRLTVLTLDRLLPHSLAPAQSAERSRSVATNRTTDPSAIDRWAA